MALLKVLLLLLGLGVSVNSGVSLQKRIIGSLNCDDGERLHHVRLESSKGDKRIRCGGSLIHPEWILTAAHCWKPGWSNLAVLKVHPQTAGQQIQVIQYATQRKNGLILLKLQTPVTDVRPAQLPNCRRELGRGDTVKLAGEGGTTPRPNNKLLPLTDVIPSQLQCVNMKVVQVPYNHPTYGHIYDAETTNKDMCKADVGGAAMHNGMIYGVAFFSEPHYTCQSPVVIKDVCDSLGWIKETVIK